jgi:hypothetical protein
MKKLLYFNFKKFLRSIWFKSNSYKLYLNLSATLLHKVSRSRFLHITSLALLTLILLSTSCNTNEPQVNENDLNKWKRISEFDGMDVKGFKIINDELYVYGWGDNNGLYKTADGSSWTKINLPDTGNFHAGVSAITMRDQELVVAPAYSYYKRLCKVDVNGGNEIIPTEIPIEIADMEVLGNNLIIAPGRMTQYNMGVLSSNGELKLIADSIYTNPYTENECYTTNGIRAPSISKIVKLDDNSNYLIGGDMQAFHFITRIDTTGFNCFNTRGVSTEDKFTGSYDIVWYRDTLFAATQRYVKYFSNDKWEIYKDSLPLNYGLWQIANSITFDKDIVFVATTNYGVLEWLNNKWTPLNEGLPSLEDYKTYYPGISWIIVFNNNLFIGFGTGKVWDTGMRGVWKYSLNN